jgi:hypothetical protein
MQHLAIHAENQPQGGNRPFAGRARTGMQLAFRRQRIVWVVFVKGAQPQG